MKVCGRCGTQNPDQQAACTGCGLALLGAPLGTGTLVLPGPGESVRPPAASSSVPPALGTGTLVIPAPTSSAPPVAPAPNKLKGTMLGLAPPGSAPPPADQEPTATSPAAARPALKGTMLGLAPPSFSSTPPGAAPPSAPPATASAAPTGPRNTLPLSAGDAPAPSASAAPSHLASAHKTMLGVARPGIAPMNPGQAKSSAPPAASAYAVPGQSSHPPAPLAPAPEPPARRVSVAATLAIIGAALLLSVAALGFFMLKGRGNVTARAGIDALGRDQLELSCAGCQDGTSAWIGTARATFSAGKASLLLPAPLKVGDNPLALGLERPGRRREQIQLNVPVEYRVRGGTEQLAAAAPKISVVASALPGTKLVIDGKPVTLDAAGSARVDFDVAQELTGPDATLRTLQRRVSYSATPPGGAAHGGEVEIRLGVTPLVIDAPGAAIVLAAAELTIAGRTAPGATLLIGNDVVPLDPAGRFAKKQALPDGETNIVVRATLRDHAPRLVAVRVRRSKDIAREAALARGLAQASYAEVLRAADAASGRAVAFDGTLFDLRRDGYSSVILLDVKNGCQPGPCLAKLLYGTESGLTKGQQLSAFGKVVRFVDGPRTGQRIPEVRAELLVAGGK